MVEIPFDFGATGPIDLTQPARSRDIADFPPQPIKQSATEIAPGTKTETRKLGFRDVALTGSDIQKMMDMILSHQFGHQERFPRLRTRDLPLLEELTEVWEKIYNEIDGAAYPGKALNATSGLYETVEPVADRMAKIVGPAQADLRKYGVNLSHIAPIEGSLAKGFTEPYMEIRYRNPYKAWQMRRLLKSTQQEDRQPKPKNNVWQRLTKLTRARDGQKAHIAQPIPANKL